MKKRKISFAVNIMVGLFLAVYYIYSCGGDYAHINSSNEIDNVIDNINNDTNNSNSNNNNTNNNSNNEDTNGFKELEPIESSFTVNPPVIELNEYSLELQTLQEIEKELEMLDRVKEPGANLYLD